MKFRLLKLSALSLLLAGAAGCSKYIDNQSPSSSITDDQLFSTIKGFEQATYGMYFRMIPTWYVGGDYPLSYAISFDILADNLIQAQAGRGSQRSIGLWQIFPSSELPNFTNNYAVIRAANQIIENKDRLSGTNNFYGEALAMRALLHFDLLRIYSKPLTGPNADPGGLGVPYVTSTDVTLLPGRETVKAVYDKVVADLQNALTNINTNNGGPGRLNKNSVYALLSRVYLWGGEYQKCIDAVNAMGTINPGSRSEFANIWTDATNNGVIFKLQLNNQNQDYKVGVGYFQRSGATYIHEWVAAKSLYDMYDDSDIRKSTYFVITGTTPQFVGIKKWESKAGTSAIQGLVDAKLIRGAEVLLNKAEAHAMLNQDEAAREALDNLRSKRYDGFTTGTETGNALKAAIDKERRLELAFEGDRWFTLKRKGLPVERDAFGDELGGGGESWPANARVLPVNDHRWQMPIGLDAILANGNLQQNPGYPQN